MELAYVELTNMENRDCVTYALATKLGEFTNHLTHKKHCMIIVCNKFTGFKAISFHSPFIIQLFYLVPTFSTVLAICNSTANEPSHTVFKLIKV